MLVYTVLLMFDPVWSKADALFLDPLLGLDDLSLLKNEAMALEREFHGVSESLKISVVTE
jgi:hypothetical protein